MLAARRRRRVLAVLVGSVFAAGYQRSTSTLHQGPALFGQTGGGIAPAFVGTIMLIGIATASRCRSACCSRSTSASSRRRRSLFRCKFWLDVLNGFPSIVIGIFVFALAVGRGTVLGDRPPPERCAGGFALSIIMLPLIARTTMEVLALVPNHLREASYALGVSKWRTVISVVLPSALGGIVTGTTSVSRGRRERLRRCCSSARSPRHLVSTEPSKALATIPITIFSTRSSPIPGSAGAGLGGGVRPDRRDSSCMSLARASCTTARVAASARSNSANGLSSSSGSPSRHHCDTPSYRPLRSQEGTCTRSLPNHPTN